MIVFLMIALVICGACSIAGCEPITKSESGDAIVQAIPPETLVKHCVSVREGTYHSVEWICWEEKTK
jgi:hypothetical protein